MKKGFLLVVLFVNVVQAYAQSVSSIKGRVVTADGKPFSSVNIRVVETSQLTTTNADGEFKLNTSLSTSPIHIDFSFLGYQKQTKEVTPNRSEIQLGTIDLKELNLSLETIEINAQRDYNGSSNSSIIINRDIIEQTTALSLSDLLNQLPNRKISAPSLQSIQNITLRGAFSGISSGKNVYEMNNAFGVAVIVDGNAISNNMNMQSFNPNLQRSSASGTLISSGTYGLSGATGSGYTGDTPYSGIDLRQIPASNIESIEVISGVAPAKYGDLTDGAILLERQAGRSPVYFRMQLRDNATSYDLSKGFHLGKSKGDLNIGMNYVNSFADNRDKLKAYQRINLNSMYTNYFGAQKRLKNTLSFDYGRNLDGIKKDPDDISRRAVYFNSWNLSVANRTFYRFDNGFLKNISLNLRYATGHQESYNEQFINEAYLMVSNANSTGIFEGQYLPGIYTAQSLIDGRPLNITARLDFNSEFNTGGLTHFLGYGATYSYGKNNGLGQVLDPSRPRVATNVTGASSTGSAEISERYYDFSLAFAQNDVGLYVEDVLKPTVFGRPLNIRAGLRYDLQNNLPSFSPRLNVNYELHRNVRIGFAYGLSYKSPALGQRYPGPTYFEVPLLNAYNGKAAESIYLVYVNRFDPTADGLQSSYSQTFEFSGQVKINKFSLSVSAYTKQFRDGFGSVRNDVLTTLPVYSAAFRHGTGQQPIITQTGTRNIRTQIYNFGNNLASDNQGFDFILNTPEFKPIATSFSISGGLFRTKNKQENPHYQNFQPSNTNPAYAITGIFPANQSVNYSSNARITSTTHIPKISLFVQLVSEFAISQKTINVPSAGIPLAYYAQDASFHVIENFDPANPNYGHLRITNEELTESDIPHIIPNFHLSLGKEIKKRFKIAFNVYNFLNYQPYYVRTTGTYVFPNSAPSFGAEISLKL